MLYVYCAMVSLAANVAFFVGLFLFARWALPRYGMGVMRAAMAPRFAPPVIPPTTNAPVAPWSCTTDDE